MSEEKVNSQFDIPIMICTFIRLDTLKQVFEKVRKVQPKRLYLVSDGPRESHPDDVRKIQAVQDYLNESIDWDCEVFRDISEVNLGCGRRMPTGVSWVFEHEERAIFLEDDCVPDDSFFIYAKELLEKYADDERIMLISGNNQIAHNDTIGGSYGFSKFADIWGWASWRRAWEKYDFDVLTWKDNKKNPCWKKNFDLKTRWFMSAQWDTLARHGYDAWDYQLTYALGIEDAYCIIPTRNMVSNVGFCATDSTHTVKQPEWMRQDSKPMKFPLQHPGIIERTESYDFRFMINEFKAGYIVHAKHLLGMDVNKSVFEIFRKKRK